METANYKSALEESSTSMNNVFVPLGSKRRLGKDSGLEYHSGVITDAHLYDKVFETNAYHLDQETHDEFYTTIFNIMNKKELGDFRNVGTVVGTAAMTILGCFTFGTAAIGGIAGFIFGGTMGRCVANRMQLTRKKKNEKMTQEDLYMLKLNCLLEAGNIHKNRYRNNINKHRLLVEKTIAESRVALESSVFKDQKAVNGMLDQYRKYVLDNNVHKSVLLSYKLLKESMKRSDMNVLENQRNASKHINEVLVPYVRLIELDKDVLTKNTKSKNYTAYFKIKAFFTKDGVEDLSAAFSEHRVTPEVLENLKTFLNQEVQSKEPENQKRANKYLQFKTATIDLKKSSSSGSGLSSISEKSRASPSPISSPAGGRRKTDLTRQNSPMTIRETQNEDVGEGVQAHMASLYESKVKSKNAIDAPGSQQHLTTSKPFSNALLNLTCTVDGDLSPDRTRKANMESLDFYQAKFFPTGKGNPAETIANMAKNGDNNREENKEITAKPLIKLHSTYQTAAVDENNLTDNTGMKDSVMSQVQGMRDSVILQEPSSPTKSPSKSGSKSPLAKLFSKKKVQKETKTPKASTNIAVIAEKDEIPSPGFPEKQADQGQEDKVLDEAEELLKKVNSVGNDQEIKWEKVVSTATITIEKVKPENSPVVLLRCWAFIEGFSPDEIFEQIYNTEKRAKWETVTMGLREVEKISDTQHFIYFYVKTPMGISERDFVQRRNYKRDYPEKGTITMSFKSTTHPSVPPLKNKIRAETYFAGYIVRPSKRAPNSTDICILSQVDIKGNIPKAIVNMVAGKAPAEWVNKLVKACEKARQEKP